MKRTRALLGSNPPGITGWGIDEVSPRGRASNAVPSPRLTLQRSPYASENPASRNQEALTKTGEAFVHFTLNQDKGDAPHGETSSTVS